jgi:glycosyltransferase involved in cell wall biosynthesis
MSDVMPYPSTRFSAMTAEQLEQYRARWREHLRGVLEGLRPDVIHAHHAWIVGSLLRDLAPTTPLVLHGHGTELRQLELCPHLAGEVTAGCRRADRFALLHDEHARRYRETYGLRDEQVTVVGAGYREDLFHARGRADDPGPTIFYAGKLSRAKGLPWLLDAVERLARTRPDVRLHVAGSGAGAQSDALRARMQALTPHVVAHGQLGQAELGELCRTAAVFVLPSFSEGLPLVLVEALACGCRLVATRLPGVVSGLAEPLGDALELVDPPRMLRVDEPDPRGLPAFVEALAVVLDRALQRGPVGAAIPPGLERFTWSAVFRRVEALWRELPSPCP